MEAKNGRRMGESNLRGINDSFGGYQIPHIWMTLEATRPDSGVFKKKVLLNNFGYLFAF